MNRLPPKPGPQWALRGRTRRRDMGGGFWYAQSLAVEFFQHAPY